MSKETTKEILLNLFEQISNLTLIAMSINGNSTRLKEEFEKNNGFSQSSISILTAQRKTVTACCKQLAEAMLSVIDEDIEIRSKK